MNTQNDIINLQMHITRQDKDIEDLNQEVIRLSKLVEELLNQNKMIITAVKENLVKPQEEETPPPHY